MIDIRLATASISTAVLLPFLLLVSVEALDYKLCPRGNITVRNAANNHILVTPDRCFPVPSVDRNSLNSKPEIQIISATPGSPFRYTVLMVEMNKSFDKYDVFWLETNLTVNAFHVLVRNMSEPRIITKMIEFRPPKASSYNLTYLILVYKQTPSYPVDVPHQLAQFKPNIWAISSHLTLVGGAEFIVKANQPLNPAHHQPLPAVLPSYPVINTGANNNTYRNYTNGTYPRPPPYNPSYHPPQPVPPPHQPYQPYQPPPHQPYPVHPATGGHNKKGQKGGAAELQAVSYLITLLAFIAFTFNI